MTVDPALVTRKLLLIAADLDALRPVAERGLDAYLASHVEQAFVERYLERSIGRMIDVNYHLITGSSHPPPPDYHASFVRLAELGVLDAAFARDIARAAGLRNRAPPTDSRRSPCHGRRGDMRSTVAVLVVIQELDFGVRGFALVNLGFAVVWLIIVFQLAREYRKLTTKERLAARSAESRRHADRLVGGRRPPLRTAIAGGRIQCAARACPRPRASGTPVHHSSRRAGGEERVRTSAQVA